jgi:uncharacterized surface protein with fasciclin (FAS1) repeats
MQVRTLTRKMTAAIAFSTAGLMLGATALAPSPASAAPRGNTSAAEVLAADGNEFDSTRRDFDITEAAVLAVLDAKPNSAVGLLTQGRQRATVFAPTDAAFFRLVEDLTGDAPRNEAAALRAVTSTFDIDTIEQVLLYHVVAGKTLGSTKVLAADGGRVETALGQHLGVRVGNKVALVDADRDSRNARVTQLDINKGNKQIVHGISQVLRPLDL